ncbi:uncharacterized protein C14orf132 [Latimeria chalumnae]|uniref:uncharacterized protein C14orf132 n=1 Tax=Latimeria chalumnae TaxID=7897 RepID=UPI00313D5DFC
MELSLMAAQFPAMSGAFLDSPYNEDFSLQTSLSNIHISIPQKEEVDKNSRFSSDAIWLWIAIIATIGNIIVVGVTCACTF